MLLAKNVAKAPLTALWNVKDMIPTPRQDGTPRNDVDVVASVPLAKTKWRPAAATKDGTSVKFKLERKERHTLVWDEEIRVHDSKGEVTIRPGRCNLYCYPLVVWQDEPTEQSLHRSPSRNARVGDSGLIHKRRETSEHLSGRELELMNELIVATHEATYDDNSPPT